MTQKEAVALVISIAVGEIGYKEKASNRDLDSKTGNAGGSNYTKYARDLDNIKNYYNGRKNGYDWCDVFYDWLFVKAFGYPVGREMIYQPEKSLGAGTPYSANYYKQAKQWFTTPQAGDQVFFLSSAGKICHTGIVEIVTSTTLYTIEGNSGNAVTRRSYSLKNRCIAGYGRPNWALVAKTEPSPAPTPEPEYPVLDKGDKGDAVKDMQNKLIKHGFYLPKYGADGDFGNETLAALKAFQKKAGLEVDGICGPLTWGELNKEPADSKEYTVKAGDTLIGIAQANGTTYLELARINNISYPYMIRVGQKIKVLA